LLGALGLALSYGAPAWAQGAAKPAAKPDSGLLALLLLFSPTIIIIVIIVFFMIPMTRRLRRSTRQINRSLEISEENLLLAKQQVALQEETNRLLQQLIETLGRD
jgi:hypothetical protein